jgi:DNA-binding protein HU-beta
MPAGLHPADSVNQLQADLGIPPDSIRSGSALKEGGDVTLSGIGKLAVAKRDARQARNPSTGAMIDVPAKTVVKFKVAKDLADSVA